VGELVAGEHHGHIVDAGSHSASAGLNDLAACVVGEDAALLQEVLDLLLGFEGAIFVQNKVEGQIVRVFDAPTPDTGSRLSRLAQPSLLGACVDHQIPGAFALVE